MPTPRPELSLPHLRCFATVAESGSFAEAGRRLGMSTSAVSKAIARFEAAHGLKLLHRSTHSLSLTEDGERLLDAAQDTLRGLTAVETCLDSLGTSAGSGRVRLNAPVGFMRNCLAPLLPAFLRECPQVHLDLRGNNELIDLAQEGVDLAVRSGPLDGTPGHLAQPWFQCPWVVCASPAYLAEHGHPEHPSDLARHVLIGFRNRKTGAVRPWRFRAEPDHPPGTGHRQSANPAELVEAPCYPRASIDDGDAVWTAACRGAGLVMGPLWMSDEALASGTMVEVLRPWCGEVSTVSIVRRDRRHSPPRVDTVIAFLRQHTPRFLRDEGAAAVA